MTDTAPPFPSLSSSQVLRAFDVEPNDETVEGVLLGTGMQAKFPLEDTSHSIQNADEVAAAHLLTPTLPFAPAPALVALALALALTLTPVNPCS